MRGDVGRNPSLSVLDLIDVAFVGLDDIAEDTERLTAILSALGALEVPALIRDDRRWLFGSPALPEHKTCIQVIEIERAELFDGDSLVIELAFLGRFVALCNAAQLDLVHGFTCLPGHLALPAKGPIV